MTNLVVVLAITVTKSIVGDLMIIVVVIDNSLKRMEKENEYS